MVKLPSYSHWSLLKISLIQFVLKEENSEDKLGSHGRRQS
jgi:hypothetical protein